MKIDGKGGAVDDALSLPSFLFKYEFIQCTQVLNSAAFKDIRCLLGATQFSL